MRIAVFFLFSLFALTTQAQNLDTSQSKVSFEVQNLKVNTVEGSFSGLSGWAYLNPDAKKKNLLKVCLEASTIHTGISMRDKNLRGPDFFDVSQYPQICFTGKTYKYLGDNRWEVKGILQVKDQKKEITVWLIQNNQLLTCQFTINRLEYGLGPDYSSFTIGEEVTIKVQLHHR
jgi:polyisoprenoid-binding protein YceI